MKEIHIKIIDKMKSLLFLYFCVAMAFSAMASSVSDTYVIPNPQQMVCGDGHFVLRTQASFSCNLTGTDKDDFVSYVSNSPLSLTYKKKGKADITFKLVSPENAKMKEEAYRLKVTKKGIQAEATSASGLFYAFQSIVQLARESGNATYQLPEVTIEDAPRFSYRGMHLDVSRHFYTKEFVKKQIDALARYKLNRFHWHLTDGAGWRIEIKKYPELTRETAYRPFPDWKSWWNGGHGTTIGGVIVDSGKFDWEASGKFPSLVEPNPSYHGVSFVKAVGPAAFVTKIRAILLRDTGATLSPFHAFFFLQGLETLSLRVERHVENALKVVQYLNNHPQVEKVHHPSVSTDPEQQKLYKKYFPNGGGSIFTFEIKGDAQKAKDFIDNLELFSLLANVADVKSLVIHPASTTHAQLTEEELKEQGIYPNTIRLSIGTENIDDIIEDLDEAFKAVAE